MSNSLLIQTIANAEKIRENVLIGPIKFNWHDKNGRIHKESTCIINQKSNSKKYDWIHPKNVKGVLTHITNTQFSKIDVVDNIFIVHGTGEHKYSYDFKKKIEKTSNMYEITSNTNERWSLIIEKCEFEKLRWWIHVNFNKY